MAVVKEELLAELEREVTVDQLLYAVVVVQQVVEAHPVQVAPDVNSSIVSYLLILLNNLLALAKLDCNFSSCADSHCSTP